MTLMMAPRFRPLVTLAACYLAVGFLLRIALWWAFARHAGVSDVALAGALAAGGMADAVQSLYLLAPFALLAWLLPPRIAASRAARVLMLASVALFLFTVVFTAAVEYFFFDEFDARLNLVAVDYLLYPTEVIGGIRESYPLATVLAVAAAAAIACTALLRRSLLGGNDGPAAFPARTRAFAVYAALLVLAAFAFRTDTLALSANRVTNELAANGMSSFFSALRTNEIDYQTFYATRAPAQNLRTLRAALVAGGDAGVFTSAAGIERAFPARADGLGRLNVVVIVSESFGSEFSRTFGGERDWTPQFDAYAARSLRFTNMYASGTRTVRGLEAITASIPPIPATSILHREGSAGIANWGAVMRANGYATSFLYGGYGQFDDMNAFFAGNGFDVLDRRDIEGPTRFANIWGVADEDLYDLALRHFDARAASGHPFFAIVMNTSNHKPFTFRAGVPGVREKGGGREAGVRYADFAQAYFLREAERHAWFDDTVFVIVADHGARAYGREDIPLRTYRIPMIVYAPRHIAPATVPTLTTQIDVAPTILGLLGLPYRAPFFGQDVRHTGERNRVAFFNHNHDVALLRGDELAILGLHKSEKTVFYDPAGDRYRNAPPDSALDALAIAYYQTASELFTSHRYTLSPAAAASPAAPAPVRLAKVTAR